MTGGDTKHGPEGQSRLSAGRGVVRIEQLRVGIGGEGSTISDLHDRSKSNRVHGQPNSPAGRRHRERTEHQVEDGLTQLVSVAANEQLTIPVTLELDGARTPVRGQRLRQCRNVAGETAEIHDRVIAELHRLLSNEGAKLAVRTRARITEIRDAPRQLLHLLGIVRVHLEEIRRREHRIEEIPRLVQHTGREATDGREAAIALSTRRVVGRPHGRCPG